MNFPVRNLVLLGLLGHSFTAFSANLPPVITLISPIHLAAFSAPATIPLTVSTSDPDVGGTVVSVEYFMGSSSLGVLTTPPFGATLSGVGAGTYILSAKATDNLGAVTSSAATVTVYGVVATNTAPTVSVNSPVISGSAYSLKNGPVVVPIQATAADTNSGGSINRLELYINGNYLGGVLGGVLSTNLALGNPATYSIVARAYDNLGIATTSAAKK